MKRLLYILLLFCSIAKAQESNDPANWRLNNLGFTMYVSTDFSDTVQVVQTNGFVRWLKPLRLPYLTTTQQNALSVSAGFMVFNSDTNTVAFYDGSAWQYFATRAYARSLGGGGGGGVTSVSATDGNGFDFTVTNPTTTPAISLAPSFTGWVYSNGSSLAAGTISTGLTNSSGTLTSNLSTGVGGGQSVVGGTASGNSLTLSSTTNATKGSILFGTSSYNEATNVTTLGGNLLVTSGSSFDFGTTGTRWRQLYVNGININTSVARADNTINVIPGFTVTNGTTPASSGTVNIYTFSTAASTATSGTTNFVLWGTSGFTPTSGTAIFNQHRFAHTINQTGGASGITRTLFIDPTITSAADYRAIENTVGGNAFNSTSGFTWIGSSFAATPRKLYVNGSLGINKDSVTLQTTASTRQMVTIDTATGKLERVASTFGTYTPTLTNGTNVSASSVQGSAYYQRVGNLVTVWGHVEIDPVAASTSTILSISLPISSALTQFHQLSGQGMGNATAGYVPGFIAADVTNDVAQLDFTSANTSAGIWSFRFSYEIL